MYVIGTFGGEVTRRTQPARLERARRRRADSVELKDFVRETLLEIAEGVKLAGEGAAKIGAEICPNRADMYGATTSLLYTDVGIVEFVSFDVAVTVNKETEAQATAGILIAAVGLGGRTKLERQHASVSRIQFRVPVALPCRPSRKKNY